MPSVYRALELHGASTYTVSLEISSEMKVLPVPLQRRPKASMGL